MSAAKVHQSQITAQVAPQSNASSFSNAFNTTIQMPPVVSPIFRNRADSGIELDPADIIGPNVSSYDQTLTWNDYRLLSNSDPFAWQVQRELQKQGVRVPQGGYTWSCEIKQCGLKSNDRINRIWENYFWAHGDREIHLPPVKVMSSVPETKFEQIALCTYLLQQGLPKVRCMGRLNQQGRFHNGPHLGRRLQPPPTPYDKSDGKASKLCGSHTTLQTPYLALPMGYVSRALGDQKICYSIPLEAPDRFYALGEEAVFVLRTGQYTPLRDEKGRMLGDRFAQWSRPRALVYVEKSVHKALRRACRQIYVVENTRTDR